MANVIIKKEPLLINYDDYDECRCDYIKYTASTQSEIKDYILPQKCKMDMSGENRTYISKSADDDLVRWGILKDNNTIILKVEIAYNVETVKIIKHGENKEILSTITITGDGDQGLIADNTDTANRKTTKSFNIILKGDEDAIIHFHELYTDSHDTQINNSAYNRQYSQRTTETIDDNGADFQECPIGISVGYAKLWWGYDYD